MGGEVQLFTVESANEAEQGAAKAYGVAHDGLEYRLHVRRRTGDGFEDLCRRCLLVQRFLELGGKRRGSPLRTRAAALRFLAVARASAWRPHAFRLQARTGAQA